MKRIIIIPKLIMNEILTHAKKEYPNECCGLLAGKEEEVSYIYKIENEDKSADTYFMNPKELFYAQKNMSGKKQDLIGIYHSHSHSEAFPSKTDIEKALWSESGLPLFPKSFYFIISLKDFKKPTMRVFKIKKDQISERRFNIV